jgi:hypothetical protein
MEKSLALGPIAATPCRQGGDVVNCDAYRAFYPSATGPGRRKAGWPKSRGIPVDGNHEAHLSEPRDSRVALSDRAKGEVLRISLRDRLESHRHTASAPLPWLARVARREFCATIPPVEPPVRDRCSPQNLSDQRGGLPWSRLGPLATARFPSVRQTDWCSRTRRPPRRSTPGVGRRVLPGSWPARRWCGRPSRSSVRRPWRSPPPAGRGRACHPRDGPSGRRRHCSPGRRSARSGSRAPGGPRPGGTREGA